MVNGCATTRVPKSWFARNKPCGLLQTTQREVLSLLLSEGAGDVVMMTGGENSCTPAAGAGADTRYIGM